MRFDLPSDYKESDGDLLCNSEAWESGTRGGCRPARLVFPLQKLTVLGVPQWIPAQPEENLVAMYGPTWRIPRPKGYKMLLCGWMPVDPPSFLIVWMIASLVPLALWIGLPPLWERLCVAVGRRPPPHKYAILPLHVWN